MKYENFLDVAKLWHGNGTRGTKTAFFVSISRFLRSSPLCVQASMKPPRLFAFDSSTHETNTRPNALISAEISFIYDFNIKSSILAAAASSFAFRGKFGSICAAMETKAGERARRPCVCVVRRYDVVHNMLEHHHTRFCANFMISRKKRGPCLLRPTNSFVEGSGRERARVMENK